MSATKRNGNMKTNKKRKLEFIREKNRLRFGYSNFEKYFKVNEQELTEEPIKKLVSETQVELRKKFKISLNNVELAVGRCGSDLIDNLITLRISLSK